MEFNYLSAFIVGFLGGGHCIAMCGGITAMLTTALPKTNQSNLSFILAYNVGRIFSYTLFGLIAGLTGSLAVKSFGFPIIILNFISGIFLVLLGLYLGQWFMGLNKVEQLGKFIWRYISPHTKKFIPIKNINQSLWLGILWGWLPCGLVYSTLTWSLASGSMLNGGLIMFCFGLGTLPALVSMSLSTVNLKKLHQNNLFRKTMALLLVLFGVYSIFIATVHII